MKGSCSDVTSDLGLKLSTNFPYSTGYGAQFYLELGLEGVYVFVKRVLPSCLYLMSWYTIRKCVLLKLGLTSYRSLIMTQSLVCV